MQCLKSFEGQAAVLEQCDAEVGPYLSLQFPTFWNKLLYRVKVKLDGINVIPDPSFLAAQALFEERFGLLDMRPWQRENGHQEDLKQHQHQGDNITHHHHPSSMPPPSLTPLSSTSPLPPSTCSNLVPAGPTYENVTLANQVCMVYLVKSLLMVIVSLS